MGVGARLVSGAGVVLGVAGKSSSTLRSGVFVMNAVGVGSAPGSGVDESPSTIRVAVGSAVATGGIVIIGSMVALAVIVGVGVGVAVAVALGVKVGSGAGVTVGVGVRWKRSPMPAV